MSGESSPLSGLPKTGRRTFAKFVVAGGGAAVIFLVLSYAFVRLGAPPFAASFAAYALAFSMGYCLQRGWTFGARHAHGRAFPRYLALQAGCGLSSGVVSHVAVADFRVSPLQMAIVTTLIVGVITFFGSRYWVFPHERKGTQQPV